MAASRLTQNFNKFCYGAGRFSKKTRFSLPLFASGGVSYAWGHTRVSADMLLGTGLRADLTLPDGSSIPNGANLTAYTQVNVGASHVFHIGDAGTLTARLDVINVADKVYEIRDGTGVGVGAPQYGPRRGVFLGLSKSL